jgi:chemotaxis family two-component system response regulator Rcp1
MSTDKAEVLLVEDKPAAVRLTLEVFKESPASSNLRVVNDGLKAMAFLRRQGRYADAPRPDLILLDLNLPEKNGYEVLAEIKSDNELKRIPVLILTVSDLEEDIIKAYDLHANCYITKPIHLGEFVKIIKFTQNFWLNVVKLPEQ